MPLIVQAAQPIADSLVSALSGVLGRPVERLSATSLRAEDGRWPEPALIEFCSRHALDAAQVPVRGLGEFGLIAMDMDSTLITIECIDEIADMQGLKPLVAAITERSMAGEIDFSTSLTERVALLAGLPESVLVQVFEERVALQPGAEETLRAAHQAGLKSLLLSGGFTFFTERLQQRLGLSRTVANRLEVKDGKLTGKLVGGIVDAQAKADALVAYRDELGLRPDQTIAFGDGANDLAMFRAAGVSVAFRGKPVLKIEATCCFDHVGWDGLLNLFPA